MKRTTLNALVDALAGVLMLALASTGLVMWLRLPPGSGHSATVLSLGRHDWGAIHSWIAIAFLATLAVHLSLHWKWIVSVTAGQTTPLRKRRLAAGTLALLVAFAVASVPLAAPLSQTVAQGDHRVREGIHHLQPTLTGRTTIDEAATLLGIAPREVTKRLGLPPGTPGETHLGPAARELGVTMEQLRALLAPGGASPSH